MFPNYRLDLDGYFAAYLPFRSKNTLLGIELGLVVDNVEENRAVTEKYPFDYIIGSVHVQDGYDIWEYFSTATALQKKQQEIYSQCFASYYNFVKAQPFIDAVGHIDHICRYGSYEDKNIDLKLHGEELDRLFLVAAERDLALEINTRRFADKSAVESMRQVYKRFRERGGKYCTLGSDAHKAEDLGASFTVAKQLADDAGLQLVYFKNRKMQKVN